LNFNTSIFKLFNKLEKNFLKKKFNLNYFNNLNKNKSKIKLITYKYS